MKVVESEKDKKQLILMLLIAGAVIFLFLVIAVFLHSKSEKPVQTDVVKTKQYSDNQEQTENSPEVVDNSSIEGTKTEDSKHIDTNSDVPRDLNDPFYSQIKSHMARYKNLPYNDILPSYYPKDNYIANAAREDGSIHIFKKNPILIYVPKNEYYDAIAQAFVTYNYQFKGLLSFKATDDPNKSDIKIVFTDKLSDLRDDERAIGVGGPKRHDKDGNITYSELTILNKNNGGYNAGLIAVYNVILHEIGHCIGIAGHSPVPNDVLYKEESSTGNTKLKKFSSRDIETIKLMYSGRNDIISTLLRNVKNDKLHENIQYAQNTNSSDAYLEVADSYYHMGKYDEALNAYKKAMEVNPNNPKIYLKLGNTYIKSKNYEQALYYLKYAVQKANTTSQKVIANDNIAYVYAMKKDYENAMNYYFTAMQTEPDNKDEFFNYLEACWHANKKDKAKEVYNSYIHNYNPDNFSERDKKILEWINNSN